MIFLMDSPDLRGENNANTMVTCDTPVTVTRSNYSKVFMQAKFAQTLSH